MLFSAHRSIKSANNLSEACYESGDDQLWSDEELDDNNDSSAEPSLRPDSATYNKAGAHPFPSDAINHTNNYSKTSDIDTTALNIEINSNSSNESDQGPETPTISEDEQCILNSLRSVNSKFDSSFYEYADNDDYTSDIGSFINRRLSRYPAKADGYITGIKDQISRHTRYNNIRSSNVKETGETSHQHKVNPVPSNELDDYNNIYHLTSLINDWSIDHANQRINDSLTDMSFAKQLRDLHIKREEIEASLIQERHTRQLSKRRNRITTVVDTWQKEQDELERLRKIEEEERKKREEEERLRKLEEEKKRREEEERLRLEKLAAEKKKQEEEALEKKKLEDEAKAKEEKNRQDAAIKKKLEEDEAKRKADEELQFVKWSDVEKEWHSYKKIIVDINNDINDVVKENKELKSFTFKAKREIKKKMTQMSTSLAQLTRIMEDIKLILTDAFQFNEIAYKWLLNFMAKALVNQAETEVIVNIQAANAIGILATHMMTSYQGFKEILIARIIKKCPYLVGYTCDIDTEEGRRRMGWKYLENANKWEDETAYAERMGGICGIWSVITQLSFGAASEKEHPYPISNSWKMLARLIDTPTEKLTNAHFCVAAAWWDIATKKFLIAYGRQADKLLEVLWNDWTSSVSEKRFAGAARLRLLGEEWRNTGKAPSLKPLEA